MAYALWYRPKYCIIGVENKSSRISLNLELVHRYNTNVGINNKCKSLSGAYLISNRSIVLVLYSPTVVSVAITKYFFTKYFTLNTFFVKKVLVLNTL